MYHPPDICMIVDNDVSHDGRVLKEAASLTAAGWQVVVVGISASDPAPPEDAIVNGFRILVIKPGLLRHRMPGRYGKVIRRLIGLAQAGWKLRRLHARTYHAHDFTGLLALIMGGLWRHNFVYDSHELFFDRNQRPISRLIFGAVRNLEPFMARKAQGVITVSDPIADTLAERLDIPRPLVVRNAVDLRTVQDPVPLLRQPGQRFVAHTGHLSPGRHLPELVAALQYLPDDVALVFIGDGALRAVLEAQTADLGLRDRVMFVPPVPVYAVAPTLAQADCAMLLFTPDALNYQYALPNKFFEAVAAGVPLVYGTTQEVNRLAQDYDFGVSCDPTVPRSIADAILRVLEPEANTRYRANALEAREALNWEQEEKKLIGLYQQVLDAAHTNLESRSV